MNDWVIRKNGYFYRPNRRGYTASALEAGRYSEAEAKHEAAFAEGVTAHPLSDFVPGPGTEDRVVFEPPVITADAVRAYRGATGAGMMEAKVKLRRAGYEAAMNRFRENATIQDKVDFILDWITDKEMGR